MLNSLLLFYCVLFDLDCAYSSLSTGSFIISPPEYILNYGDGETNFRNLNNKEIVENDLYYKSIKYNPDNYIRKNLKYSNSIEKSITEDKLKKFKFSNKINTIDQTGSIKKRNFGRLLFEAPDIPIKEIKDDFEAKFIYLNFFNNLESKNNHLPKNLNRVKNIKSSTLNKRKKYIQNNRKKDDKRQNDNKIARDYEIGYERKTSEKNKNMCCKNYKKITLIKEMKNSVVS